MIKIKKDETQQYIDKLLKEIEFYKRTQEELKRYAIKSGTDMFDCKKEIVRLEQENLKLRYNMDMLKQKIGETNEKNRKKLFIQ